MVDYNITINDSVGVSDFADVTMIYNFASQHMGTAIKFAQQAGKIECDNVTEKKDNYFTEMRTLVSSAIILTVCALEANINEYFATNDGVLKDYILDDRATILKIIDFKSIKDKYQLGLILNHKPPLQFDKEPFESFRYLLKFRNALVHYKPETSKDMKVSERLEKQLKNKFNENRNADKNAPFISNRAMSYDCIKWAVNTALDFSRAYSEMTGIANKFSSYECL
jgi:hypothetical protein